MSTDLERKAGKLKRYIDTQKKKLKPAPKQPMGPQAKAKTKPNKPKPKHSKGSKGPVFLGA